MISPTKCERRHGLERPAVPVIGVETSNLSKVFNVNTATSNRPVESPNREGVIFASRPGDPRDVRE